MVRVELRLRLGLVMVRVELRLGLGLGILKYLMDLPTSSDDFAVRIEVQGKALLILVLMSSCTLTRSFE
jgi:regulator of sirC expression with transglutaminase-like and TPR domain